MITNYGPHCNDPVEDVLNSIGNLHAIRKMYTHFMLLCTVWPSKKLNHVYNLYRVPYLACIIFKLGYSLVLATPLNSENRIMYTKSITNKITTLLTKL